MDFSDTLKLVGAIAGIAALIWRALDEFGAYLRISLAVDVSKRGWATALSTVDNKGFRPKKIKWAFLLIGPEAEDPRHTINSLLTELKIEVPGHRTIESTNAIFLLKSVVKGTIRSGHRMLVPVPFYFSENVDIADETLTYSTPIEISEFPTLSPFSVRFFIGDLRRLHRSTHQCFIVDPPEKENGSA